MRKLRKEKNCLNCGNEVPERFCTHCGQENLQPRESFKHIMSHFITDYLHLDEKFWSSIKPLLFKPGFLTLNYNAGKRASYVHPFRLYIFITIIFFIISPSFSNKEKKPIEFDGKPKQGISIDTSLLNSNADEVRLSDSGAATSTFNVNKDSVEIGFSDEKFIAQDSTVEAYHARQMSMPESERDGVVERYLKERSIVAKNSGVNLREAVNANFKKNTSKMIFILLPIFALLLKLFFRREKLYYVEHFFHSVYLHSFLFLTLIIFGLIVKVLPGAYAGYMALFAVLSILVYFYQSFRVVYKEHALISAFKFAWLIFFYFIAFFIVILINAVISFLML